MPTPTPSLRDAVSDVIVKLGCGEISTGGALLALRAALAAPYAPAKLPPEVQRLVDAALVLKLCRDGGRVAGEVFEEVNAVCDAVAALPATPAPAPSGIPCGLTIRSCSNCGGGMAPDGAEWHCSACDKREPRQTATPPARVKAVKLAAWVTSTGRPGTMCAHAYGFGLVYAYPAGTQPGVVAWGYDDGIARLVPAMFKAGRLEEIIAAHSLIDDDVHLVRPTVVYVVA